MPLNADARIFAGLFAPGDHAQHALEPGRGAWVQVVRGTLRAAGVALAEGDGAAITDTDRFHLEFDANSEVLLFDVRLDAPLIWR